MQLYQSNFLNIKKQGTSLVQQWSDKPITVDEFQKELLIFLSIFKKENPKKLLWDNQFCKLTINEKLGTWMGENILFSIHKKGIKKLLFTIPEKIPVYLSIVNSMENLKSILPVEYFNDLNEAKNYLEHKTPNVPNQKPSIKKITALHSNSLEINLDVSLNDLPKILSKVRQIEKEKRFKQKNQKIYDQLTSRETEIFRLIAHGFSNKEIGSILFIEESSVKTHRKNIKSKLNIKNSFDIYQYARSFDLI